MLISSTKDFDVVLARMEVLSPKTRTAIFMAGNGHVLWFYREMRRS